MCVFQGVNEYRCICIFLYIPYLSYLASFTLRLDAELELAIGSSLSLKEYNMYV